jgi:DNA-binding transcriptional regulator YiaG
MTPEELRERRRKYNLSQSSLAKLMGVTANTVARWERGEVAINQGCVALAFEVLSLRKHPRNESTSER